MSNPKTSATPANPERTWRTFLSFMRPYRAMISVGAVLGVIATVANLWFPRLTEYVIDALATGRSTTGYLVAAGIVTLVGLAGLLGQFIVLGRTGETVVFDVRAALVKRILRGSVPEVLSRSSGDLVSRATADAPLLQLAVSTGFVSFVTAIAGVIGTIVFMGVIDGVMLGITLAAVAVLAVFMGLLMPRAGRERALAQDAVGALGGELDGTIKALRTIKSLGAEDSRGQAALDSAHKARKHGIAAMVTETLAFEIGLGGMAIVTVVMLGFGAWRVSEGHLSIAALVAFIMYAMNFTMPLMEVASGFQTIQQGLAASKRIAEAEEIPFEESDDAAPATSSTAPARGDVPILELRGVTAAYNPRDGDVVTGLDLTIPRTGHVALVGPSGAGKTSTMSLLLRFLAPRAGQILLDGVSYDDLTFAQVRERFAYVEQEPTVLPGTVRDNLVAAKPDATDAELHDVLAAVHLDSDVASLPDGLDTTLIGATMTGGGRQRLALARALLRNPDVLLLDEPTSQIAGSTEDAIHEAIAATAAHRAVVTIAHREETVRHADTIVVMEAGRVRATGTHAELLATDALYQELMSNLRINDGA
ncbi:ABC transporter ATP-binding protein [Xylanimonas protaetiae]|uniref:ABC transporter ATP-binding protein n=1 Tax=Xylanimonas protaetiae TaxID=2509457 RepID=A0A4P6F464_9MICO|nr:ABC transporter ATP-binding protein [Xylanimonas protaetiae]QAY69473.1 ABC transporter ATP-binding protein [Xylanimonas protaetiae]